jgi:hypothetical protein
MNRPIFRRAITIGGIVSGVLILPFSAYVGLAMGNALQGHAKIVALRLPAFISGMLFGVVLVVVAVGALGACCGALIALLLQSLGVAGEPSRHSKL